MTGYSDFLFWFSSAILLCKIKSLFLNLYTSSLWVCVTTSIIYYHEKCVLIHELKDFCWWNFDTQFECTGVLISKATLLRSIHLTNIYFFWNCLRKNLLLIRLIITTLFQLLAKNLWKTGKKKLNALPQHNPLVLANQNLTIMMTRK